ncbi:MULTISPECIES: hypothetical protein [Burkholderia]|uniref:hypothetical protein n=1 Tax=Burkholderia TaxID=32008 RepID=UPI0013639BA8|nr:MULTISPECIES: hypothetical protein [Burkholderia]
MPKRSMLGGLPTNRIPALALERHRASNHFKECSDVPKYSMLGGRPTNRNLALAIE